MAKDELEKLVDTVIKRDAAISLLQKKYKQSVNALAKIDKEIASRDDEIAALKASMKMPPIKLPKLMTRKPSTKSYHAVPTLLLSDLHWGEVVFPTQVGGINKYNSRIARARLVRVVASTIKHKEVFLRNYVHDYIVVNLAGDLVTGVIHDMDRTNDGTMMEIVADVSNQLAIAIQNIAEVYPSVIVNVIPGNHDRTLLKVPTKNEAKEAWTWIIGQSLATCFARHKSVYINVPDAPEMYYKVYDTMFKVQHGHHLDKVKGRNLLQDMTNYFERCKQTERDAGKPVSIILQGHFHTSLHKPDSWVSNGSLKGYDEFAKSHSFPEEDPKQTLLYTTPEHGMGLVIGLNATAKGEDKLWNPLGGW